MNRRQGIAALLTIVGVSIVFGMILGGKQGAPQTLLAAREAAPAFAQAPPAQGGVVAPSFADIAEGANPAVVSITNSSVQKNSGEEGPHEQFRDDPFFRWFFGPDDRRDRSGPEQRQPRLSSGSGFLISSDGYILTNNHVVEGSSRLVVDTDDGRKFNAEVVGTDPAIDLALIKIDSKGKTMPALPLGDSDKLRVGEWVIAIGNPLGLGDHSVTVGVVSAKGREIPIGSTDAQLVKFIQTDAAINFGNSGGPLLDGNGRVVGINTAIIRGNLGSSMVEGIGFAVPINEARRAAEQLRATGSVQRGYLGITMVRSGVSDAARDSLNLPDSDGVIVESVVPDGPSAKAGVREDDVIRKVEGEPVKTNQDLLARIASRKPGEKVDLELLRDGKTIRTTVALGSRPARGLPPGAPEEEEPGEVQGREAVAALGLRVEGLTPRIREQMAQQLGIATGDLKGVVVSDVALDSPAGDEGIEAGNLITSVNNHDIESISDWNDAVGKLKPGDAVKLKVRLGELSRVIFLRVPDKKGE